MTFSQTTALAAAATAASPPPWRIKLLYDGACPLCMREVTLLQRRDAGRGLVTFVDIADAGYAPRDHGGVDFAAAMGRIHAVLPDGTVIQNLEVFRQIYQVLGLGWIYGPTRWPLLGAIADWAYGLWADWRLRLTGRPDLETILTQRQGRLTCADGDRCTLPHE